MSSDCKDDFRRRSLILSACKDISLQRTMVSTPVVIFVGDRLAPRDLPT